MKQEIQEFLEVKSGYLTPGSIQTYKRSLSLFAEIVDLPFEQVRDCDLTRAITALNERYKDTTVQNIMNAVHSLFKFWEPELDCLNHERIHVPRALAVPRYAATFEDYQALKSCLPVNRPRSLQRRLALELLWCTGMRVGEMMSLRIDQLDLVGMKATVKTEKTKAYREVFWTKETNLILKQYLAVRQEIDKGSYLFIALHSWGRSGQHLSTRSIERWFKGLVADVGLNPKLVPHSMRHSRIQRWFAAGLNAYEVIMLTGHRSVTSLVHYMRLNNPQNEANARKALLSDSELKLCV